MARIHIDTLPFDVFGWIFGIRAFLETVERALPDAEKREMAELERLAEAHGIDEADPSDLEAKFRHWIPRLLSYSIVTSIHTLIETQLLAVATRVGSDRSAPLRVSEIAGDPIERAKTFLDRFASIRVSEDPAWQTLRDIELLRHLIVHRKGQEPKDEKKRRALEAVLDRYKDDLKLSWGNAPLKEIDISFSLCHRFLNETEAFFRNLLHAAHIVSPSTREH